MALLKKSGVRGIQQEMDWIGLQDFLKAEKRSTEEVQAFITKNQLKITEVVHGQSIQFDGEGDPLYDNSIDNEYILQTSMGEIRIVDESEDEEGIHVKLPDGQG